MEDPDPQWRCARCKQRRAPSYRFMTTDTGEVVCAFCLMGVLGNPEITLGELVPNYD